MQITAAAVRKIDVAVTGAECVREKAMALLAE